VHATRRTKHNAHQKILPLGRIKWFEKVTETLTTTLPTSHPTSSPTTMPCYLSPVSKSHEERSAPHSASPAPTVVFFHHSYDYLNIWQREWLLLTDSCTLAVGPTRALCICHEFIILDFRRQYYIGPYQHHKRKCVMLKAMKMTDAERLEKLALVSI